MGHAMSQAAKDPFLKTDRQDNWWIEPLLTIAGLGSFGLYATWAAFQNANFEWGPYLSPFYSPHIQLSFMPDWFSPALLILPFPLLFRATCYYYRKAYYRAFFGQPPACAVAGNPLGIEYKGETIFPFVLQNFHRFAFYFAALFIIILWYDAFKAFFFSDGFGVGVGSLIMVLNVVLLSLYTFSCHSWRHLIGGRLDCFSCDKMAEHQHKAWGRVSHLNENHMRWAWLSLFGVWGTDLYIRLVASGVINDWRIL